MSYSIPIPDPTQDSQFFTITRLFPDGRRDEEEEEINLWYYGEREAYKVRLLYSSDLPITKSVSSSFESSTLEHAVQEGFSLDHVRNNLITFEIEATLYEGREERLYALEKLRKDRTLLEIACDFGVFKNYIISKVEPEMSNASSNAFPVSIAFQEVRNVKLTSTQILTYTDEGEVHSNETKKKGSCPVSIETVEVPGDRSFWENAWDNAVHLFTLKHLNFGYIKDLMDEF